MKSMTSRLVSRYSRLLLCVRTPFSHHLNNRQTKYNQPVNEGIVWHVSFLFIFLFFIRISIWEDFFSATTATYQRCLPGTDPIRSDPVRSGRSPKDSFISGFPHKPKRVKSFFCCCCCVCWQKRTTCLWWLRVRLVSFAFPCCVWLGITTAWTCINSTSLV